MAAATGPWLTLPFLVILLAGALWARGPLAGHARPPGLYDLRGRAMRLDPGRVIVWGVPAIIASVLPLILAAAVFVPPERQNGDPLGALLASGVPITAAQALAVGLTLRRRRAQRR